MKTLRAGALLVFLLASYVCCAVLARRASVAVVEEPQHKAKKNRPVSKVILLLKNMQEQLEKEQAEDESVYSKLDCWCKKGDGEKTKSIAQAKDRVEELNSSIEEYSSAVSRLKSEIKAHRVEVEENQLNLDAARKIRRQQSEAAAGNSKGLTEAVASLKAAITVLAKHHTPPAEALVDIANMLRHHIRRTDVGLSLTKQQLNAVQSFAQADYLDKSATFKSAYTPQSGEIFGILKQMKETFERQLGAAEKQEQKEAAEFLELEKAKEAELAATKEAIDNKTKEQTSTEDALAEAKQDVADTGASLSADEKYLMDLKLKCQATDSEWEERSRVRKEEMVAVAEALQVLSNDDAHDLFTRHFNPSFVQTHNRLKSYRRSRAAAMIRRAARSSVQHPNELLSLASHTQLDSFKKVKAAIDLMVEGLKKEMEDEMTHKDWCTAELANSGKRTQLKNRDKSDAEMKNDQLKQGIETHTTEISEINSKIAGLQADVKKAAEDRELEKKDFQVTLADARETQRLLQKALDVLTNVYEKRNQFVQTGEEPEAEAAPAAGPPAPDSFKEYKKQGGASGVLSMMRMILNDAARMEKEATDSENEAEKSFQTFLEDTKGSVEAAEVDLVNKQSAKAQKEQELAESEGDLTNIVSELSSLSDYALQVHQSCDFLLKNYEIRVDARTKEIETLHQAKAFLSGMAAGPKPEEEEA